MNFRFSRVHDSRCHLGLICQRLQRPVFGRSCRRVCQSGMKRHLNVWRPHLCLSFHPLLAWASGAFCLWWVQYNASSRMEPCWLRCGHPNCSNHIAGSACTAATSSSSSSSSDIPAWDAQTILLLLAPAPSSSVSSGTSRTSWICWQHWWSNWSSSSSSRVLWSSHLDTCPFWYCFVPGKSVSFWFVHFVSWTFWISSGWSLLSIVLFSAVPLIASSSSPAVFPSSHVLAVSTFLSIYSMFLVLGHLAAGLPKKDGYSDAVAHSWTLIMAGCSSSSFLSNTCATHPAFAEKRSWCVGWCFHLRSVSDNSAASYPSILVLSQRLLVMLSPPIFLWQCLLLTCSNCLSILELPRHWISLCGQSLACRYSWNFYFPRLFWTGYQSWSFLARVASNFQMTRMTNQEGFLNQTLIGLDSKCLQYSILLTGGSRFDVRRLPRWRRLGHRRHILESHRMLPGRSSAFSCAPNWW